MGSFDVLSIFDVILYDYDYETVIKQMLPYSLPKYIKGGRTAIEQ